MHDLVKSQSVENLRLFLRPRANTKRCNAPQCFLSFVLKKVDHFFFLYLSEVYGLYQDLLFLVIFSFSFINNRASFAGWGHQIEQRVDYDCGVISGSWTRVSLGTLFGWGIRWDKLRSVHI